MMSEIHSSAVVEKGAILGENVIIEPYAFIGKNAVLGDECVVKQAPA